MRLTMVLTTGMLSAIIPMYIFNHGIRGTIPLFFSLVCSIIGSMIAE